MGKIVTSDDGLRSQGIISDAKKVGKPKDGLQMWRVVSQIKDPTILKAFGEIPYLNKE